MDFVNFDEYDDQQRQQPPKRQTKKKIINLASKPDNIVTINKYLDIELIPMPISQHPDYDTPHIRHYNRGDLVIVSIDILQRLEKYNNDKQFHLKLINQQTTIEYYVAIGEFTAPERIIYIPDDIYNHLAFDGNQRVIVRSINIPKLTSVAFSAPAHYRNPKPVIEHYLQYHRILFIGKIIKITMFGISFNLEITDMAPDFAGYIENSEINFTIKFY